VKNFILGLLISICLLAGCADRFSGSFREKSRWYGQITLDNKSTPIRVVLFAGSDRLKFECEKLVVLGALGNTLAQCLLYPDMKIICRPLSFKAGFMVAQLILENKKNISIDLIYNQEKTIILYPEEASL
jgi:hypothetical protein